MTFFHLYTTQSCLVFEDIRLLAFHDFFNSFEKFSVNSSVPDINCFLEKLALTLSLYKCSCHFRTPVCKSVCCTLPFSFNFICLYPWWSNPILAFPVIFAPLCFLFLLFFSTHWQSSLRYFSYFLLGIDGLCSITEYLFSCPKFWSSICFEEKEIFPIKGGSSHLFHIFLSS